LVINSIPTIDLMLEGGPWQALKSLLTQRLPIKEVINLDLPHPLRYDIILLPGYP